MKEKARIAVLVSGGGTNLQALLDAQQSGVLHSGEIVLVVSNNSKAFALERAAKAGVETAVRKGPAFEDELRALLKQYRMISSFSRASCAFSAKALPPNGRTGF